MSSPMTREDMKALVIGKRSIFWPFQAVVSGYVNHAELVDRPVPQIKAHEILVKVEVFAANPTDLLHLDYIGPPGSILGCDFVGTVVAAGEQAKHHPIGRRVTGVVHGGKYRDIGSAADYCVIEDDLAWEPPRDMSSEDAVTFGVGFTTAAAVLYHSQRVPLPPAKIDKAQWYLVSGGATAVGQFMIQLAHTAGFRVIASASPRNFELARRLGADLVVNYADRSAALNQIREATGGGVDQAVDCVGGKDNLRFAIDAFGPQGGPITSILPGGKSHRNEVKLQDLLLYCYLGKSFTFIPFIMKFRAEPEKREWLKSFSAKAQHLIEQNDWAPNPIEVKQGLETILEGWTRIRDKKVSGRKLVYRL